MSSEILNKTFTLISLLGESTAPLSLKELTDSSSYSKPTVHRLLQDLMELGYVEIEEKTKRYFLSNKLFQLDRSNALKLKAMPVMERLYAKFNETLSLGVLFGLNVKVVEVMESNRPLKYSLPANTMIPFYTSAMGMTMVAHMEEEDRKGIIERLKVHLENHRKNDKGLFDEVCKKIQKAKKAGYTKDKDHVEPGVMTFALPLNVSPGVSASISLHIPLSRLSPVIEDEVKKELEQIAKQQGN